MQRKQIGRIVVRFGQLEPHFHIHVIFATDRIIAHNPDAARRFLAGWFETIAWMRAHKADTVRLSAPIMGVDPTLPARSMTS